MTPQSAGINVQSTQSELTPRRLTSIRGQKYRQSRSEIFGLYKKKGLASQLKIRSIFGKTN